MLNRLASLAMSTCVLKALPGKLDIKRHSPSILYVCYISFLVFPRKRETEKSRKCNSYIQGRQEIISLNRGSYMSAHVLFNLLNELGKRDKMRGLPSILSLFRNEFNKFNNTRALM